MRANLSGSLLLIVGLALPLGDASAQRPNKTSSRPVVQKKAPPRTLDPWDRPTGSIVDQTARYYVWYDKQGWHVRATAKGLRDFQGTLKVKDAKIRSCVPVGLKDGKQKGNPDAWRVNDARSELKFQFKTSNRSDGFDLVIEGDDGQIEFDLGIDSQKNAKAVFVGSGKRHPAQVPFTLPAMPMRAK